MKVQIVRSVLVTPTNGTPRPADAGEVVDVDKLQAALLIGMGKAVPVDAVEKAAAAPRGEKADARPAGRSR